MVDRPFNAMSRGEFELINKCQRALDDGTNKDLVEKLRLLCLTRGACGIIGLGRAFRRMDDDGSNTLTLDKFVKGIHDTGLELPAEEATEMFKE